MAETLWRRSDIFVQQQQRQRSAERLQAVVRWKAQRRRYVAMRSSAVRLQAQWLVADCRLHCFSHFPQVF